MKRNKNMNQAFIDSSKFSSFFFTSSAVENIKTNTIMEFMVLCCHPMVVQRRYSECVFSARLTSESEKANVTSLLLNDGMAYDG